MTRFEVDAANLQDFVQVFTLHQELILARFVPGVGAILEIRDDHHPHR
jgi:hypothetical protein